MGFNTYLRRLGRRIKAARLKCGLRQVDIEERIGLAVRHLQQIEAGRLNVTLETLYKIADACEMRVHHLMPKARD